MVRRDGQSRDAAGPGYRMVTGRHPVAAEAFPVQCRPLSDKP